MRIYVDVDGTMTERQHPRWSPPRLDVIARVKAWIAAGHDVVVWSGTTRYARAFCRRYGIVPELAIGKPGLVVDNHPRIRSARIMPIIDPNAFLSMEIPGK